MASVGAINVQMGMDSSRFTHGLKSSIAHTRSWARDMGKQFDSMLSPMQRYRKELTRLNLMRAGVFDPKTGAMLRLSTEQHAMAVRKLRLEYSKLIPTLRTAQQRFLAVGTSMRTFFGTGGLMFGMAAVGTAFKAGRTSENFEKSMRRSLAIMFEVTEQQKTMMREQAKAFSGEVLASAADLAGAYYYLAQTGMDAKSAIAALPTVARFAQAGMFDLSRATDLLTDAQIAMGLHSKNAQKNLQSLTHVGNVLVKASTLANASVEQFSEALTTKAAATGRLYGQTLEEVVAVLAAFASAGIKGAAGGEQYSIVMRHLAINAVKNAEAFKRLNVNVFDANRGFSEGADIIRDLDRAMANMTPRQKVLALMELGFTKKTIASTGVLLGMSEALGKVGIGLEDVAGVMKRVADDQLTPFQKGWNKVRQAFENLTIDRVSGVMEALGNAMEDSAKKGEPLYNLLKGIADLWGLLTLAPLLAQKAWIKMELNARSMGGSIEQVKGAFGPLGFLLPGGDTGTLTNQLDALNDEITRLDKLFYPRAGGGSEGNGLAADIAEAGKAAEKQGQAMALLAEEIEKARKATETLIATWKKKVDTQNFGKLAIDLREMAAAAKQLKGWTQSWNAYERGSQLIREFYANEKKEKDRKRAESLSKGVRSPIQAFSEGAEEAFRLRKMLGEGAYARLIDKYRETALRAMLSGKSGSVKLPAAMTVGSREAYSAVARGGAANIQKQTLAVAKKQLAAALRQIELAEKAVGQDIPVEIERM